MTGSRIFLALILIFAACCCKPERPAQDHEDPFAAATHQLLEADRAFARSSMEMGLDGWMSYFATDAARVDMHGEIVRGLDKIRASDRALFKDPSVRLQWEPADAGVFKDGQTGFTRGRYQLVRSGTPPTVLSQGSYLTIWRKEGDRCQVILDTGAPDCNGKK